MRESEETDEDAEGDTTTESSHSYEEKADEPVLVYFQEIRSVPLLDRSGEVEIAKRIEIGREERLVCALQSPLVVGYLDTILKRLQEQGEPALEEISEEPDKNKTGIFRTFRGTPHGPDGDYSAGRGWQSALGRRAN